METPPPSIEESVVVELLIFVFWIAELETFELSITPPFEFVSTTVLPAATVVSVRLLLMMVESVVVELVSVLPLEIFELVEAELVRVLSVILPPLTELPFIVLPVEVALLISLKEALVPSRKTPFRVVVLTEELIRVELIITLPVEVE